MKRNSMFTQRCFIRKNNPRIRLSLIEFGKNALSPYYLSCLVSSEENFYSVCNEEEYLENMFLNGFIDCGTNEELFLAIAALRNDLDRFQWFVDDFDDSIWQKSEWNNANFTKAHKATVEELIKHFTV